MTLNVGPNCKKVCVHCGLDQLGAGVGSKIYVKELSVQAEQLFIPAVDTHRVDWTLVTSSLPLMSMMPQI